MTRIQAREPGLAHLPVPRLADPNDSNVLVRTAVRSALMAGATAVAATAIPMESWAQEVAQADELEVVTVTGSRIRRVETETASPVLTITAETIADSGSSTLGELLQDIPSVSGAATNPATNNGGGDGAANIELRGLDVARTLVLLNGKRVGALGQLTNAVDVNAIPVNMIERVEVLKEGAGAIYGSDAVAGVVNFITKTNQDGGEASVDYGISGESDGDRTTLGLSWGATGDRSSVLIGFNYNQQDSISAGDRVFSRNAIYFYGSVFEGGSSRTPGGRIDFATPGCGSGDVTRIDGAAGDSVDDFRCFVTTGDANDFYNFQPVNLVLTPQERASVFTVANYEITDQVEVYTEFYHTYTSSGFAIAPLPFDARSDNVVISAQSIYNPFGIDFGGIPANDTDPLNPNALFRLEALGNRRSNDDNTQTQVNIGFRGENVFGSNWNYDVYGAYGRIDQDTATDGYLFKTALIDALGPSFIGPNGPTCGTPAAPINGCVPVNIFNLGDPSQVAALGLISAGYNQNYQYTQKIGALNLDGELFELPAGMVQAAVGYEYREQAGRFDTDFLTQSSAPLFKDCLLQGETCSGDNSAKFDVNEVYAEFFVPLLKDIPLVNSLGVTAGIRYSDYSTFGDTTNAVFKVEYRPIDDILVRGSFSEIFRAPTVLDLSRAPTADAATFNDPCVGLTQAAVNANPNLALACVNVPRDGTFSQPNSQVDGLLRGNPDLQPETGEVYTFGVVYDPGWLEGLSVNVDYWQYEIEDVLTSVDVNTAAEQCAATGAAEFCGLIARFADGTILQIQEPTLNLGKLETSGVDFGARYRFGTPVGDFRVALDGTYTDKYDSTVIEGGPVTEIAGTYDRQYGNYAQWRGTASLGWRLGGFEGLLVGRYIDSIRVVDPDGAPGTQPDLEIGAMQYLDVTLGYTLEATNTKFRIGVDNATDKQPPILYQNNVLNANTDVATYDTVGRFFWVNITQKF